LLTGKENIDRTKFIALNVGSRKLYKFRSLNVRKFFFSQRVVDIWNSLPKHVMEAESVNSFNRRLDKCKEWGV